MGVNHLWSIIEPAGQHRTLSNLSGQTLAVDLSIWVCESNSVKQMQGVVLRPHLRNIFFRVSHLTRVGVKLVFVVDGDPPEIKWRTMEARCLQQKMSSDSGREPRWKKRAQERDIATRIDKPKKRTRSRFQAVLNECCEMLDYLGVPHVQATGEAEAMCAFLNYSGVVDACITDDGDAFLYGAQTVYRNFTMNVSDPHVECYTAEAIKDRLAIDRNAFVAMGLLLGCDYLPKGVPGVGRETFVKLIRTVEVKDILLRMKSWNVLKENDLSTVEKQVRKKALSTDAFPFVQVIDEYLVCKDKLPSLPLTWTRPKLGLTQLFMMDKQEWPEEYTRDKVVPLVTLFDMRRIEEQGIKNCGSHMIPLRIFKEYAEKASIFQWVKQRNDYLRVMVASHVNVVLWKYSNPDGENYTTIEDRDLFSRCFPDLVHVWMAEQELAKAKKPVKGGNPKPKSAPAATSNDVDSQLSAVLADLHLTTAGEQSMTSETARSVSSHTFNGTSRLANQCQGHENLKLETKERLAIEDVAVKRPAGKNFARKSAADKCVAEKTVASAANKCVVDKTVTIKSATPKCDPNETVATNSAAIITVKNSVAKYLDQHSLLSDQSLFDQGDVRVSTNDILCGMRQTKKCNPDGDMLRDSVKIPSSDVCLIGVRGHLASMTEIEMFEGDSDSLRSRLLRKARFGRGHSDSALSGAENKDHRLEKGVCHSSGLFVEDSQTFGNGKNYIDEDCGQKVNDSINFEGDVFQVTKSKTDSFDANISIDRAGQLTVEKASDGRLSVGRFSDGCDSLKNDIYQNRGMNTSLKQEKHRQAEDVYVNGDVEIPLALSLSERLAMAARNKIHDDVSGPSDNSVVPRSTCVLDRITVVGDNCYVDKINLFDSPYQNQSDRCKSGCLDAEDHEYGVVHLESFSTSVSEDLSRFECHGFQEVYENNCVPAGDSYDDQVHPLNIDCEKSGRTGHRIWATEAIEVPDEYSALEVDKVGNVGRFCTNSVDKVDEDVPNQYCLQPNRNFEETDVIEISDITETSFQDLQKELHGDISLQKGEVISQGDIDFRDIETISPDQTSLQESDCYSHENYTNLRDSESKMHESETRLQDSESNVQESKTRLWDSESKIQESKTRLRDSESNIQESKTRLRDSESKIQESKTRLRDSESNVQESKTRLRDSESNVQESKTRLWDSESNIQESKTRLRDSESNVQESKTRLRDSESNIQESEVTLQKSETYLRGKTRCRELQENEFHTQNSDTRLQEIPACLSHDSGDEDDLANNSIDLFTSFSDSPGVSLISQESKFISNYRSNFHTKTDKLLTPYTQKCDEKIDMFNGLCHATTPNTSCNYGNFSLNCSLLDLVPDIP